jgi:GAF domain-containing protein
MDPTALHEHLAERSAAVLAAATTDDLAEVEAHLDAGCSRCARALVNARDATVLLAESAPAAAPGLALRTRVLGGARAALTARREQAVTTGAPSANPRPKRFFFDPAGELARLHIGAPGDAERTREIDALQVTLSPAGDASGRLLAELQREVGFPLLFVSVVRGARVGYRVQCGLDLPLPPTHPSLPVDRRRETSFCTHTVSTDAPLVVPDAAAEPFFRGSAMVVRDGIRAYIGVPLRTSRSIVVGTVCAMDFTPRRIGPAVVRTLERFAARIAAEIERGRGEPGGDVGARAR